MRGAGLAIVGALLAVSCQVQIDDVVQTPAAASGEVASQRDTTIAESGEQPDTAIAESGEEPDATTSSGDQGGALPDLGPLPAASHWHAAYVVRICDDVLDPIVSDNDPLGIHTHGDGLMHIHPFFEEAGYEQATIGVFADAVGLGLREGELTLPTGGTWRDGDLCDGVPGRVFVDRWQGPLADSPVERIFTDLESIRFTGDAEVYQIAFAPADSLPVVPPSVALLPEVSNLGPAPEPWIEVPSGTTADQVSFWPVGEITSAPCGEGQVPERVSGSNSRCFVRGSEPIAAVGGVVSARAVAFNRRPAVEIIMDAPLQAFVSDHFATTADPFVFAIELDGAVATVARLFRPPLGGRLVVASGFSEDAARALATLLDA